jgi:hypothetical protein
MIEQKKKLRLDEIHVDSFITNNDVTQGTVKGGTGADTNPVFLSVCQACASYIQLYCSELYCYNSNEGGSICVCTLDGAFVC